MKQAQQQDKLTVRGKKVAKIVNAMVDYIVLIILLLLLIFASYYLWDSNQIHSDADSKQFEIYKPAESDFASFDKLCKLNSDVFAWLTVYGTNIDYPVLQANDNDTYLRTDAFGKYSMAGSIFLDHRNDKHFTDYNSIIYGHHMAENVMFGEIDQFKDKQYFKERKYGNLFFNKQNHGLEFFAFLETNGYDGQIYTPAVQSVDAQSRYLANIQKRAMHTRDINIKKSDKIVLLSTCSSDLTNGRHVLAARLSDKTFDDPFADDRAGDGVDKFSLWNLIKDMPLWGWLLLFIFLLLLLTLIDRRRRKKKRGNSYCVPNLGWCLFSVILTRISFDTLIKLHSLYLLLWCSDIQNYLFYHRKFTEVAHKRQKRVC